MPKILTVSTIPHVKTFTEQFSESAIEIEKETGANSLFIMSKIALETGYLRYILSGTKKDIDPLLIIYSEGTNQPKAPQDTPIYTYNLFNIQWTKNSSYDWAWCWVSQEDKTNGKWYYHWEKMVVYKNFKQSLEGWVKLLSTTDRYSKAWSVRHDVVKFAEEVEKAGFATGKDYAKKIINISKSFYVKEDEQERMSNTVHTNGGKI